MVRTLDGTELSRVMRAEMAQDVAALQAAGVTPGLSVVLVGNNPASQAYVASKTRACEALGMRGQTLNLPEDVSKDELFAVIDRLNQDPTVHGILVQLPLPAHLPYKAVLEHIRPEKDVDGFHPLNAGLAFVGDPRAFVPCTPAGIMEMLRRENVPTRGKHVVIVGRSLIVSKPLASLLMAPGPDATVTLTHRHTPDLATYTRQADILIVAVGKQNLITADMVKPGVVVIDVGQNRVPDTSSDRGYRMVGDVDYDAVRQVASAITPVPGGVGPMTITMLLANTIQAARQTHAKQA
ncbi:bifunctional methylenetetrahydrofolate dehydrogenase/methenyltetrahydrofolate cyclohydrolase FolD [Corallococcus sp. H22C18031201]|uniref:bifunctional methylenetetrahydrofolate dehydrogenase/methenyltetrahydrofolate cyclohydrolase FolD n=1 Tax=Citreicoccus inhibens TaxID=2849499 RepID=UPI000E7079CA|nr:bifunctional methylenetetrahydrofolate dehydrogenase/methenyltetrahydrofolate cyclohydrolase FolD [Citreicoccus inhibens]MBU8897883.1 bifunctional methylenetetrahydrofolate dehydrogenase/methenyltetrahydrofolate cyclohydrolase FolD [Citreicoccus inhibens]RJS17000.1 bifunctional methylenetetrahydrofolate dehydrogenase/methenyltetrahydrofolate cyclohydrolase FolD [Corallococcus sp. H22C18031201]